jgi:hypothetical protein
MGEQPHGIAIAPDLKPIAVVLGLMDPTGAGQHLVGAGGDAGRDEAGGHGNQRRSQHLRSGEGSMLKMQRGLARVAEVSLLTNLGTVVKNSA